MSAEEFTIRSRGPFLIEIFAENGLGGDSFTFNPSHMAGAWTMSHDKAEWTHLELVSGFSMVVKVPYDSLMARIEEFVATGTIA